MGASSSIAPKGYGEDDVLSQSESSGGALRQLDKPVEILDAKRLGDVVAVQNGLANNVPGGMINGTLLKTPVALVVRD